MTALGIKLKSNLQDRFVSCYFYLIRFCFGDTTGPLMMRFQRGRTRGHGKVRSFIYSTRIRLKNATHRQILTRESHPPETSRLTRLLAVWLRDGFSIKSAFTAGAQETALTPTSKRKKTRIGNDLWWLVKYKIGHPGLCPGWPIPPIRITT